MGYFDGLANGNIKKDDEGRIVFYPLGILGNGRVLPDKAAEQRVREFLIRYYKVLLLFSIGLSGLGYWGFLAMITPIFGAWFYFGTRSLVAGYPYSGSKLTLKEACRNSAASHNTPTLWVLLTCSALFSLIGIIMNLTAQGTGQRLGGLFAFLLFGAAGAVIAYMIKTKRT